MFMVNMMDERRYPYVVDYEDDDSDLSINSCDILELTPSGENLSLRFVESTYEILCFQIRDV